MSKEYKQNAVYIIECSVKEFSIALKNKQKKNLKEDSYTNANFFGNYSEGKEKFTLPVGHLVCDYDSDSDIVKYYCKQRGKFNGNKFCFDSGNWEFMNPHYRKALSTFVIENNKPKILEIVNVGFQYSYAISGIPVIRNSKRMDYDFIQATQKWSSGSLYATKHIFVGLKPNSDIIYLMSWKSSKSNLIASGEAYSKFISMGFSDVIKVDGGGSHIMKYKGKIIDSTSENRRDNAFFIIKHIEDPASYPKPTRILKKGCKGEDVKWLQYRLKNKGYDIEVDGSFGSGTEKILNNYILSSLDDI